MQTKGFGQNENDAIFAMEKVSVSESNCKQKVYFWKLNQNTPKDLVLV